MNCAHATHLRFLIMQIFSKPNPPGFWCSATRITSAEVSQRWERVENWEEAFFFLASLWEPISLGFWCCFSFSFVLAPNFSRMSPEIVMSTVDALKIDGTAAQNHRPSSTCWKTDLCKHWNRGANVCFLAIPTLLLVWPFHVNAEDMEVCQHWCSILFSLFVLCVPCQTCFTLSNTIKSLTLLFRLNRNNCAHLVY